MALPLAALQSCKAASAKTNFTAPRLEKTDLASYFRAFFRLGGIFFWFFLRNCGEIPDGCSYNMELRRGYGPAGGSRMSPARGSAGNTVVYAVECSVPQPISHPSRPRMTDGRAMRPACVARRPMFSGLGNRNSVSDGPVLNPAGRSPTNLTPLQELLKTNQRPPSTVQRQG
jgi:hypothetical protein